MNYSAIIKVLDEINGGDAREVTVQWISTRKAAIIRDDDRIAHIIAAEQSLDENVLMFLTTHKDQLKVLANYHYERLHNEN